MNMTHYPLLDEKLYRTVLPNGLTVVVNPRKGFQRKVAYFVTNYGSIHTKFTLDGETYETPEGVAHYLEHKMFDLPGRDVNEEFAALGANPNAFTSYDMTAYYFSCTEHFSQCLKLLLEFVSTPYFTQESVDKERGIIEQEILMYADAPDSQVFEDMMTLLYAHHPARHPIAGSVESIRSITPEILYQCHGAFYRPSNMILCVCGDVDPEEVAAIAEAVLPGEKQNTALADLGETEKLEPVKPFMTRNMDVAMPTFQLGFKCGLPGLTGAEYARWELAAELAAEALFGESSELYLRLYEEGLIDSSFGGGLDTIDGLAMLTCGGDSNDPEETWQRIVDEVEKILAAGIEDEAFARMKKSLMGRRGKDLDSFESCCFRLCAYHFDGFDYFRFPELFAQVSQEEVLDFLWENGKAQRSAMSVILPRE